MKYNIKIGEDKIARVVISGDSILGSTKKFISEAENLLANFKGERLPVVIFILGLSFADYSSVLAYRKFLNNKKLGKMAFIIKNPQIVELVKIIIKDKYKDKVKKIDFFNTEKDAIVWIKQK